MAREPSTTSDAAAVMMMVEFLRDYWPNLELQEMRAALDLPNRLFAGEKAELPEAEARKVVRAGIATLPE